MESSIDVFFDNDSFPSIRLIKAIYSTSNSSLFVYLAKQSKDRWEVGGFSLDACATFPFS